MYLVDTSMQNRQIGPSICLHRVNAVDFYCVIRDTDVTDPLYIRMSGTSGVLDLQVTLGTIAVCPLGRFASTPTTMQKR